MKRGRFFVLWLLVGITTVVCLNLLIGAISRIEERIINGELVADARIVGKSMEFLLAVAALGVFLVGQLVSLNIVAKRSRDLGFPGWLAAIISVILLASCFSTASSGIAVGLAALLLFVLAVVPSDALRTHSYAK